MYLQYSLFTAVVFIALGFASENEPAGNLVKKSLTNIQPNLVNSADEIHELMRRNEVSMTCAILYRCPTAGGGMSLFQFTANLQLNPNQAGTLTFTVTGSFGLTVNPQPSEIISVFPEWIPVGWIATKTNSIPADNIVCLVTWTLSINASMPNPNSLALYDLQTNHIKESCGEPCSSSVTTRFCTYTPAPITSCGE